MTLAECTKSMDPTVWNSYQIVSNRARAVCYAIRQQQFRWKSEMAVNQLMQSTVEQLNTMKDLKVYFKITRLSFQKKQKMIGSHWLHLQTS
jgi:hypothetical protein